MPKPGEAAPILGSNRVGKISCQLRDLTEMPLQRLPVFHGAVFESVGEEFHRAISADFKPQGNDEVGRVEILFIPFGFFGLLRAPSEVERRGL